MRKGNNHVFCSSALGFSAETESTVMALNFLLTLHLPAYHLHLPAGERCWGVRVVHLHIPHTALNTHIPPLACHIHTWMPTHTERAAGETSGWQILYISGDCNVLRVHLEREEGKKWCSAEEWVKSRLQNVCFFFKVIFRFQCFSLEVCPIQGRPAAKSKLRLSEPSTNKMLRERIFFH